MRESSIGTTIAAQAVVGTLALGAAGAVARAGIGYAAGNAAAGAAAGGAFGGSVGAVSGAAAGASDRYTHHFRHELAIQDFGSKNIFVGDLYRGFIYFQRQPYTVLRVKVTNLSQRKTEVIEIPIIVRSQNQRKIEETLGPKPELESSQTGRTESPFGERQKNFYK